MQRFKDFEEFFGYYISQHRRPITRWVHFAATHAGAGVALAAVALRRPGVLLGAPLATYGPAFASHWLCEKNSPVTLRGNILWAMRADLRMTRLMYTGHDSELSELAQDVLDRASEVNLQGIRVYAPEPESAAS